MNQVSINELLHGKTPISVSIDREARAIYFKLSDNEVSKTQRLNSSLSVDYDEDGEVVGVEIIRINNVSMLLKKAFQDISSGIPAKALATAT